MCWVSEGYREASAVPRWLRPFGATPVFPDTSSQRDRAADRRASRPTLESLSNSLLPRFRYARFTPGMTLWPPERRYVFAITL
eukprot:6223500-Prymnesium_polylepis.1